MQRSCDGRQISDTVTTLGAGVDGSVQRIDTAYNNQGLAYLLTSYADTAGTQIVNQVENLYNGLGQLTQQYQAVTGAVDTSSTPYVGYNYSDPSNGSLLTGMVYPNGRTINYNYGDTGGVLMGNSNAMLDNAIGRLDGIVDGTNSGDVGQVLEQYSYLGLSTIVARNHPQTGINLTLIGASGSIGAGGDQYVGLDQLGRIVNQSWVNSSGSTVDGYTYSYDANSNVTARNNVLDSAYSETYTYDSLNRLTAVSRGGASYQSWNLDAQGNWSSFTSSGNTQTRTANAQNQITSISGAATPTYDAAGNMISDQNGDTLVYDPWNRSVEVKNSAGVVIAQYTYDAQGWRISETYPVAAPGIPANTTKNLYYSASGQVVEERWNGTAAADTQYQYVWSEAYVNGMVLRDTYVAGTVQPDLRVYTATDANYNVTALVGYDPAAQTWSVVERFVYSPYGTVTVLSPAWTVQADAFNWQYLYQGGRQDTATGLYLFQHRNYSPSLGTWTSQDPLQYINGANTYQFVMSNPVDAVDPKGSLGGATPAAPLLLGPTALDQLADNVLEGIQSNSRGSLFGWTKDGAANYVPSRIRETVDMGQIDYRYAKLAVEMAVKLAVLYATGDVGGLLGFSPSGWTSPAYQLLLRELQAIRPLAYETYRNFWQVKLPNGWNTASVYLRYDPFTRKFTGAILGTVGDINSDGMPMGTTCTRPFYFQFSGALGPGGSVSQEVTHY